MTRIETRSNVSAPAPPHAPETGRTRRILGPFYVTGVFWYRFHRWGVSVLPSWAIGLGITIFTTFFFVALRRIRRAIASNLTVALGACGWWRRQARIYRTMWNFAWCLSERYERLTTCRSVRSEVENEDIWRRELATSAGLVVVTAHVGHWEIGSMIPGSRQPRCVNVVREEEVDPRAQAFIRDLIGRQTGPRYVVHFARLDDLTLGSRLLGALRQGEIVALQGDRPRTRSRTAPAELFGRPFPVPAGPAALARAAGVALLPVFVFREGRGRVCVAIRPPIRAEEGADPRREVERMSRQLAAEVEWAIRRRPHQWFCFRELWPPAAVAPAGRELRASKRRG